MTLDRTRILTTTILAAVLATLTSCGGRPLEVQDAGASLNAVPVPRTRSADDSLPKELRLSEGDEIVRQDYSILLDGRFTFTRSVQRQVATFGLRAAPLNQEEAATLGLSQSAGVVIRTTKDPGPARRSGLRKNDVITRFDGKEVLSLAHLEELVRTARANAAVIVDFIRGGEKKQTSVTMGGRPVVTGARAFTRKLTIVDDTLHSGLILAELSAEVRPLVIGADREENGLLVIGMLAGGPAFFSALRHRDYVVEVDDQTVSKTSEFRKIVKSHRAGDYVSIRAWRGDRLIETRVRLSEDATASSDFDILGLIRYKRSPTKSAFSVLWSLLYSGEAKYAIVRNGQQTFHEATGEWSFLLGALRYESKRKSTKLRVLWILPLEFARG